MTSVVIPNSVRSIGQNLFSGCSGLTSVTIPGSVTYIDGSAFWGCSSLTSIEIPSSVETIESAVFWGCHSLTSIYSFNPIPPKLEGECFDDIHYLNTTLYVPYASLESYKKAYIWKNFLDIQGFDPAGISDVEVDGSNKWNIYYDINGSRLNGPRKGVNIINGKKVIIR